MFDVVYEDGSPLISLVYGETVAIAPTEAARQESWRFPAQRKRELLSFWAHDDIPVCWRKAPFLILINASKPAFRFPCVQHSERDWSMKIGLIALGTVIAALAGPSASAQQVLNLSGQFRCVQGCIGPGPTYVTQNGWDLNLVNEVGQPSRAWIDWPGHIWAQYWNEGAVYSPDGMAIQFDRGSVWVRDLGPPPPPPPAHFRG